MLRLVLGAIAIFAVLVVIQMFVGGISKMDVSLRHEMERHVIDEPFSAGDVVEISADGQRIVGLLCDVDLPSDVRRQSAVRARYYNAFSAAQPDAVKFVADALKSLLGRAPAAELAAGLQANSLDFIGEKHRVVGQKAGPLQAHCQCQVAEAILERKATACVVNKSLIESELVDGPDGPAISRSTVAVSFDEGPVTFHDPSALKPFCEGLNTQAIPPVGQSCAGEFGYAPDVLTRGRLRLIREASLPAAQ